MPVSADRIHRSIADVQGRIDGLDADAVARLTENANLDAGDWATFGPMASEMFLLGVLDLDASNLVHRVHMGWNGDSTLAERIIVLQVFGEFLNVRGRLLAESAAK